MLNWGPSYMDEAMLADFGMMELLLSKEVAHERAPAPGEVVP